mgnify:CR=1 FL=1
MEFRRCHQMQLPLDPLCVVIPDVGFNSSNQALGGENTEAEAIIDRITYDGYDINIEYTGLHMAFFNSAVGVLQTLVVALGAGLGIWGAINLLEGYGNDNPGAKSQGMKQLMAGGGVALIGITLVPLLSGLFG